MKDKHIFFIPIIITVIGIITLYPLLSQSLFSIAYALKNSISTRSFILPAMVNFPYLVLFCGLILLSFTDMLFEKIFASIAMFLILAGFLFAYLAKTPLLSLEALGIGAGIFIAINITKLGSYALGDIIAAGAIGIYVGIEKIVIISIFAIILGKIIFYLGAKLDGICDKSRVKEFHFAFVPVLFLATAVIFAVKK